MAINYGKLNAKLNPRGSLKARMGVSGPLNSDYEALINKPQINGNELVGNKSNEDLGIPTKVSDLDNDLNFVADEDYVHTDNNYDDTDKGKVDALGTASTKDVPAEGNASASEVVMGSDTRLNDSRNAKDVYDWAKAQTKPSYSYSEIDNTPTLGTASSKDVATSGDASSSQVVMGNDSRLTDDRNAKDVYSWAKASTKPDYTASEVGAIASTLKGTANGVAELDANGKVPSAQLPSYVDDVLEYASVSAFPQTGESGKIYIALDTNKTYRWSGTKYTEISESLALGETDSTAYAGNKGKANADNIANIQSLIPSSATTSNKLATASDIPDISGKADKSEMSVSTSGDQTTIQLKNGTSATVLNAHQDISGKANKSEMSVSTSGDKTTIQLKNGTSAEVINQHQDISNKVDKDGNKVLSTNDYTTAEKTKLDGISDEANKVTSSSTNGHINIDGVDTTVYDDTTVTTAISGLNENVEDIQDVITTDTTSASGNPLSFSTKSAQNAINPIVTLEPIQDLHGQDKPYPAGGGKNKYVGSPYFDGYTNVSDWTKETEKYNGHDVYSNQRNWRGMYTTFTLKAGTYTFSVSAKSSTTGTSMRIFDLSGTQIGSETLTTSWVKYSVTVTLSEDSTVGYRVETPTDTARLLYISEYQIEEGSTATSYAPYENICPISGYDKIEVLGCGKNILDGDKFADEIVTKVSSATKDTSAKTISYSAANVSDIVFEICKFKTNTQYSFYIATTLGLTNLRIVYSNDTVTDLAPSNWVTSESGKSIRCIKGVWMTGNTTIKYEECGIFEGVVNEFVPYHKTTDLSENLPQTVYGGTYEPRTGVFTVTHGIFDLGNITGVYNADSHIFTCNNSTILTQAKASSTPIVTCYEGVSPANNNMAAYNKGNNTCCFRGTTFDRFYIRDDAYTDITTLASALSGQKLVYELATPFTIQLTPHEIALLEGYNYISTNGTRIDLDYRDGEMATLEDVLDVENKLQEEIDNPISYDGKNYRLGIDATGLYLYNITDDTKAYIQMVTP